VPLGASTQKVPGLARTRLGTYARESGLIERRMPMLPSATPPGLLVDLYQFTMLEAYLEAGMTETATFEFFVRRLPEGRRFLVAGGLEQALDYLESLSFGADELDWLASTGLVGRDLIEHLARFRFTGEVHAMPEGTVFFPDEPILRVTSPLPEAQLVETRLINLLQFQTVIASKASRMVLAAEGRSLVDFGLRRAHGEEAGLLAARAAYVAGFTGTATVGAARLFDIPAFGTMAHSFIQAHDDEMLAFRHFARARPERLVLLIDTYDTVEGARRVARLAPELAAAGIEVSGVRLDSGDLAELAPEVRAVLDAAGLEGVRILASGGIDEHAIAGLLATGAPIDGFGVGTSLTTANDAPALDCAYKLQDYAGLARRKRSAGKATWPGKKQVYRWLDDQDRIVRDLLTLEDDRHDGTPLLEPVMRGGRRQAPSPALGAVRAHAAAQRATLSDDLRRLDGDPATSPVTVSEPLRALAREVDRRTA
jgi:nicotinate phosphoribosyltransferase